MKKIKIIFMLMVLIISMGALSGCKPYDKPELKNLSPSQTGFLVPMQGQTSSQKEFMSEAFLLNSKIATKEIQIPHRWLQEGRFPSQGRWIASSSLIVVERKPETREWTEIQTSGTSTKNEGIVAESKESIGFMSRMNASAQIDEINAVKFLYRYNNKPLSEIMDTEIRARIESKFVEECARLSLEEILINKDKIMAIVRKDAIPYFEQRGITISVIGMKGEFTYLNPAIQEVIDNKFKSAKALETQRNENERVLSKARADATAVAIQSKSIEKSIELKKVDNQAKAIEKWDGHLSQYSGGNGIMFNLPVKP